MGINVQLRRGKVGKWSIEEGEEKMIRGAEKKKEDEQEGRREEEWGRVG